MMYVQFICYPHMMYDPKTGKGYMAKKYADHVKMDKMGYVHDKPDVDEAHAKVDQFTGHKHAKRAGINVKTHGSSMGGHGDDVTLSHPDKKKLQKYVSNHLDGETQGIKVKEMVNLDSIR